MIMQADDIMLPSDHDAVELGKAVEERFLTVCELHERKYDTPINLPNDLDSDLLLWRRMRVRHNQGDYRNSRAELKATRSVAQWVMDTNCELRGQAKQTLQWRD